MRYPFLFRKDDLFYIKIASCFDYVSYDSSWMDDSTLGEHCLVPDVDICESMHEFNSEEEAIAFIRNWWRSNEQYKEG